MDRDKLICDALVAEVKRRLFEESTPRIIKCVNMLTDDQVWWRPNAESNSIGNLVLHLEGNVRQWIMSGIAQQQDIRTRQAEFDEQGPMAKSGLLARLETTMSAAENVINSVTANVLLEKRPVQTFEESILSILVHVTEHFTYHTGQIAWITKMLTESQVGFYEGVELE